MIGIATVASPDDDGIRNDSGRKSANITIENAVSRCTAQRVGSPRSDDAASHPALDDRRMSGDLFWTILAFAFVIGTLGVVGWVFYYWIAVVPRRERLRRTLSL
jgi:hypothetical protein